MRRIEGSKFEVSTGYTVKSCLKKNYMLPPIPSKFSRKRKWGGGGSLKDFISWVKYFESYRKAQSKIQLYSILQTTEHRAEPVGPH